MLNSKRALIVGGSGQLGTAIAQKLLGDGWSVTAAQRTIENFPLYLTDQGVKVVSVDRTNPIAMKELISLGFDAVIDTICFTAEDSDLLISLQSYIDNIVVFSSASVYCDDQGRTLDEARQSGDPFFNGPIPVTQATVKAGPSTYSTQKVAMEERILNEAGVPVSIIRPAAIHGPYSHHPREWWFVKRILDGRKAVPIKLMGNSCFQTSATSNIAELVLATLNHTGTRILNAADSNSPSVLEIAKSIASVMGQSLELILLDEQPEKRIFGATPWSTPNPFILDMFEAKQIGYKSTYSYEESVKPFCDWLVEVADQGAWESRFPALANYPWNLFDYDAEDDFIANIGSY